ncbi:MAG: helix-turn-helix domain-containing protein [Flavipsychrobacter sp.]|nr:helix-turn-helix domain-containing protein [Flavipsychrobacter sp.]
MNNWIKRYRGIHPGAVLARELKKRALKQRPFALAIGEHPQTFNAIIKGKRSLNTALALKIEKEFDLDEGTLLLLQVYYDIAVEKQKQENTKPDLSRLRSTLFWDTDIEKIDWQKQYKAVIHRVFERGNDSEKDELIRFYGKSRINDALKAAKTRTYTLSQVNH